MDGSNRDSSVVAISLVEVAATEDERDELSVVEIPVIEESPVSCMNSSPHKKSTEEQSQRDDDFVSLWVPAFLSCETLHDLDDVLERCTSESLP
ncbi:hypothetical protein OUZ56_003684 [Daphnia magna]|uniref:Uncharacterized protein n=1 Tax=Daphnia magna TaxID=35525 RepID=A0ABR0A9T5_9CRUS|nr:hypothetical protein OUZ56_003684 [Daphnia magna]